MSMVDMDLQCMSWQPYVLVKSCPSNALRPLKIVNKSLVVLCRSSSWWTLLVSLIDLQSTSPLTLLEPRTLGGNLLHHIFALVLSPWHWARIKPCHPDTLLTRDIIALSRVPYWPMLFHWAGLISMIKPQNIQKLYFYSLSHLANWQPTTMSHLANW